MDEHDAILELAAAWRPQRPGRRAVRDIEDALVEPDWAGARVIAALTPTRATIVHEGGAVVVPDDLLQALLDGFSASGALVEGSLTTLALKSGEGALPAHVEGSPTVAIPVLGERSVASLPDCPHVVTRECCDTRESRTHGQRRRADDTPASAIPMLDNGTAGISAAVSVGEREPISVRTDCPDVGRGDGRYPGERPFGAASLEFDRRVKCPRHS